MGARSEGVGAVIEHLLGEAAKVGLDAKVPEDRVRGPTAEELDVVGVFPSTEEGCGATRPQRAGAEKCGVDAGGFLERLGSDAKSSGDELDFHVVPLLLGRVSVVVSGDGRVGCSVSALEPQRDAGESFRGAEERVAVGSMANSFPTHGVLLVREGECSVANSVDDLFIQRRLVSGKGFTVDSESDVAEAEGLGAAFASVVEVLGRPKQPVEGHDDEVEDMAVDFAVDRMLEVEYLANLSDDGQVRGVGASGGVVFVSELLEVSCE